ncbi:TPA: hypothetical protein RQJ98_004254 [Vibrio vulnificus]|nr:hypothetical protein [Vibrio vulnificus]HDY7544609.1 hypothetical protein [Vibrio vulnificus]HDY7685633.1 hypothetical protein [Vibrio vulnificus]
MNYNYPIELVENDVLIVSLLGDDGSYFMWQKGLCEEVGSEDGVYFEFNDQINGRHNQIKECYVTNESIQVLLVNGNSQKFYFPPNFDRYQELKVGLSKIFSEHDGLVEFCI